MEQYAIQLANGKPFIQSGFSFTPKSDEVILIDTIEIEHMPIPKEVNKALPKFTGIKSLTDFLFYDTE